MVTRPSPHPEEAPLGLPAAVPVGRPHLWQGKRDRPGVRPACSLSLELSHIGQDGATGPGTMVGTSASCCRDGLRLKSKEGRESRTLEDMLCFTKVPSPRPQLPHL